MTKVGSKGSAMDDPKPVLSQRPAHASTSIHGAAFQPLKHASMILIRQLAPALAVLLPLSILHAQSRTQQAQPTNPQAIARHPAVVQALSQLQKDNAWTLDQMVSLCQVPSPPFKEAARAAVFRDKLVALGVRNVRIDREGNVIGELRGTSPGPTVMLSGHLDTVFPEGTSVTVKRDGTHMKGPGIGDDCRGLGVVLAVTRQLIESKVPFAGRILVTGTVGEEGPGNLRGVRAIFGGPLRDSINYFYSVDGTGFSITNRAVGSNRYRVRYFGPGGHSYGAFGMPNPIHAMGRAIAAISDLQVPQNPKVTFNVGVVSGGTSVNSIPGEGVMEIDMRSESPTALAKIDGEIKAILQKALRDERARWPQSRVALSMKVDTIGIRPAGAIPDTSFIVRAALDASRTLGVRSELNASSTDANIAISMGIPAITIDGGGYGTGAHSLEEAYDDKTDGYKGPQWVMLVVLGVLGIK
jgi:acetylornithine deacetylase/succinyl-diaminopimelate desuccinylase-like protein